MADGPFNPAIMPVKATYIYNDILGKWMVKASRQIQNDRLGVKREVTKQSFDDYAAALTFVSVFFGNA